MQDHVSSEQDDQTADTTGVTETSISTPISVSTPTEPEESLPFHLQSQEHESAQVQTAKPDRKSNGLLVGLSVGALVGALIGGATGSLVAVNVGSTETSTSHSSPTVISTSERNTTVSAIAQAATESVVTVEVTSQDGQGSGSGVIYTSDGYIITNAHVVTSPGVPFSQTRVRVFLSDGTILPAEVIGTAPYADIAVIKVPGDNLPSLAIGDSEEVAVGDLAVAIGAPFNLSNTLTSGVVSSVNRGIAVGSALIPGDEDLGEQQNPWNFDFDIPGRKPAPGGGQVTLPVIQTDADINPGNSGGALLNERGELVGINVAIASTGTAEERAGSVGLGFAIPSALATRVADSIIAGIPVSHGLLGATVEDSRSYDVSQFRGGLVRELIPGGAADKAGILPGDVIVSVNGIPTPDGTSVSAMVRYFESGTEVDIELQRDGERLVKQVVLESLI